MEKTIIPKDCCLCDVCNLQLTDSNFVVTEECTWYEGWLYCSDCVQKYNPSLRVINSYKKGESVKNTELAYPMILESW